MLRIAIPNKGALSEKTVTLLSEAGYKVSRSGRELTVTDRENEIEFFYLRPRDIAVYVASGVLDLGITGRDLAVDSRSNVHELLPLNFGRSSFYFAVPKESELTPLKLHGQRIATSYASIVDLFLKENAIDATVIKLDGAVEISVALGVADVIADVVESGQTLIQAGLKTVGEPILKSEAVLVARNAEAVSLKPVKILMERLTGIIVARDYAMIEYDIEKRLLEKACELTPGIEAPTLAPLSREDWVAVKAMIKRSAANRIMDELKELGARGIIVTDIRTCRL
ncbi:MAG: ATP phosphoribosyltransferase [Deltaproteobacteria bacterium ADurb.Bin510]|jgi:ATP phosphoribosyltransferase|nr:MAG: ATP phosphoribosyltransferase [Deltaproteobacteria bacterium ADurb.Bin510]